MSTTPSVQPTAIPPERTPEREIRIYSHSNLFYWWPVWAIGFLMAVLTFFDGHEMAIVPSGTIAESSRIVTGHEDVGAVDVLMVPKGKSLPKDPGNPNQVMQPYLATARSKNLGVLYATVLLLIIVISNVPLRGLWSIIIVLGIVLLAVIFALMDWWEHILRQFFRVDVHINGGGYVAISVVLLIIWAITVFFFDRRRYLMVSSGQVRLCTAIGAAETVYDTTGMTFSKRQDDLFRHWIIGLGSGDLVIHRTQTNLDIDFPNVLFVGAKIKEIERLIKEREVVENREVAFV